MTINRREFLKLAGVGGAGLFAVNNLVGNDAPAAGPSARQEAAEAFTTELFLDCERIYKELDASRKIG
jgi:hypothetical protein